MGSRWWGRTVPRIGAAGCVLLLGSSPPASAASSITAPDGAVYRVWEVRARGPVDDPDARASAIAYSVSDASGMRVGVVPGTADAAVDRWPSLAIDPVSGKPVVVWSRSDGVYLKIAYARFAQAGWTDLHFLTFGPGNDLLPRAATSATGSYLFWIAQGSHYLSAPIELPTGWLLAAPSGLGIGSTRGVDRVGIEGGHDGPGPPPKGGNKGGSGPIWVRSDLTIDGGSDGTGPPLHHGALWGVSSDADCRSLVLTLPDRAGMLRVLDFTNSAIHEIGRVQVPAVVPERFGDDTAASYLASICR